MEIIQRLTAFIMSIAAFFTGLFSGGAKTFADPTLDPAVAAPGFQREACQQQLR